MVDNGKFSSTLNYDRNDDGDIPEDIEYEAKFDNCEEINELQEDDFVESIIGEQTEDYKFDAFVEQLQEIVIEEEFENMQNKFFETYCNEFEDKPENKLSYTGIFNLYTKMTESYIEKNLIARVPQYKLEDFYKLLEKKKNEIDDQLLDMLLSFTDFQVFKDMMLDYKSRQANKDEGFIGLCVQKADFQSNTKQFDNFDELNAQFNEVKSVKPSKGKILIVQDVKPAVPCKSKLQGNSKKQSK